ncbi:transcription antitermination factor NusB [Ponticaulis sp.]|uniref:RsmB/NOP family class I SAM-dependent RNA methyltransferase n=1 Tax=Ponticaulis sp. TaxID=2020902 RepID=UPI000B6E1367|nr:transcription antitermination factor NusB [Ponticaulis sp.]MAI89883.1 rRNA methyltransferase [Ponticaulis sp.]OUX99555.1 MAG: hypothetical protein CBB65_05535 [Hyphomonadaceae bacterium TMED5]
MSIKGPRLAAIALLTRILDHRQTLDEALGQEKLYDQLEGSDRGFARAMTSAALRSLGKLELILSKHVTGRGFSQLDPDVKQVLRIGAAQICVLKTPAHAAVSETVEAARGVEGAKRAGGLINAVLRKLNEDDLETLPGPSTEIWPEGFAVRLEAAVGADAANALAEAQSDTPPLDLTCLSDRKLYADRLGGEEIGPASIRLDGGMVESLMGYEGGAWWVQDVAATLPVHIMAPKKGERILDMCAAPGGKTLQIAVTGASVTALDRSAKRLRLVKQNLERTNLKAETLAADATKWTAPEPFDGVLLDAPCSALGTLRRHPEGPWIKSEEDLSRFPQIQARLLRAAADMVGPSGRLIYCVCTPMPREGVEIVDEFLEVMPGWKREPVTAEEVAGFEKAVTDKGDVLTLPGSCEFERGCDAFYISRLVRA